MITDEQRKAFEQWVIENTPFTEPRKYNSGLYVNKIHHVLWEAWQAAQQVNDLVWIDDVAASESGNYSAFQDENLNWVPCYRGEMLYSLHDITINPSLICTTRDQAKAAAQQDYQRRVLSCLVNGGE